MKKRHPIAPLTLALSLLLMAGCTYSFGVRSNNLEFVYPKSNVTPMGEVSASDSETTFLSPKVFDANEINAIVQKALAEKGGDVLLNAVITYKLTMMPIIPLMTTEVHITGTAAKMTVGEQNLH